MKNCFKTSALVFQDSQGGSFLKSFENVFFSSFLFSFTYRYTPAVQVCGHLQGICITCTLAACLEVRTVKEKLRDGGRS